MQDNTFYSEDKNKNKRQKTFRAKPSVLGSIATRKNLVVSGHTGPT